jgi:hypothetical protein
MIASQFKFWFMGEWRPVMNMLRGRDYVTHPEQASSVVIFIDGEGFLAAPATPAEIFVSDRAHLDRGAAWDSI